MSEKSEHIEEKIIPFLEGVLNAKEKREVEEAINSDGALAREVSELRQVILDLRKGFSAGMVPPQETLTVEEVVALATTESFSSEVVPGTSEQKARLFCSDQAMEEYTLLRALQEEMARTTLDQDTIPEMPAALQEEFRRIAPRKKSPILAKARAFSPAIWWRKASNLLDRIDPRPLMAGAAALVLLSVGVHLYQNPRIAQSSEEQLAMDYQQSTARDASEARPYLEGAAPTAPRDKAPPGVPVFVSDDRGLLKEQAEKLLARKVRIVIAEDRLLVAENDLEEARGILWGLDQRAIASNEEIPKKELTLDPELETEDPYEFPDDADVTVYDSPYAPPVRIGSAARPGAAAPASAALPQPVRQDAIASSASSQVEEDGAPQVARSRGSAPGRPGPPPPSVVDIPVPASTQPSARQVPRRSTRGDGILESYTGSNAAPPPERIELRPPGDEQAGRDSSENDEERRQRLKDLALGKPSEPATAAARPSSGVTAPSPQKINPTEATVGEEPSITIEAHSSESLGGGSPASRSEAAPRQEIQAESPEVSEGHVASVEARRATVARQHRIDISLQSESGRVTVFVRPKENLSDGEKDELRRLLRRDLGLKDTDTIIFR